MNAERWVADIQGVIDAIDRPIFLLQHEAGGRGRFLAANRNLESLAHLRRDAWRDRAATDLLPPDAVRLLTDAARHCADAAPIDGQFITFTLDGHVLRVRLAPVVTDACNLRVVLGQVTAATTLSDEAETREYEKLLLTSQQEVIPDGVLVVDEHRRIKSWNRRFEEIWHIPAALLAAGEEGPVLDRVQAQLREPERFYERIEHLYRHLEIVEEGTEVSLKDGRWLERYSKGLIDAHGKRWGRIWFFRDITERKRAELALRESEGRLRQLAEHIQDFVLWMSSADERRVIYVSPAYERIWGRPPEHLYKGGAQAWLDSVHPEDRPFLESGLEAGCLFNEQSVLEYRIIRPDGGVRWIRAVGFPIRNEAGEVYRHAGIGEDITERRETQERLWRLQSELSHLSRLRTATELASGLAHELNQPLAAIATHTHASLHRLRAEGAGSPAVIDALQKTLSQAMRAGAIVRRLRRFVAKVEPELKPVDVNDLVREVVGFLNADARQRAVHLRLLPGPALPPVLADGIQIQQVVVNLVQNALDSLQTAGSQAGAREICLETRSAGSDAVEVRVSDTGPGLPDSVRERLFQPFVTTKAQGTGLGLWISQSIIDLHGGCLTAEDRPAGGATFRFTLPVATERASERA